jgi:hypothetical protein
MALSMGMGLFGGFVAGWVTSLSFFEPPPEDCLFEDTIHWYNCVIDHQTLRDLFDLGKKMLEDESSSRIGRHKKIQHSLVIMDPQTIADDQDLDILNLHKGRKTNKASQ